ncbi:MAG TPA: hypothetical protein PLR35_12100 [Burkholderiaceae bacterium]|nr:hypothetical protein [Burkholderiaceae bacterium]
MPIVSNTVQSTTQADGSLSVVVRLYDQDAREYTQQFFAPAGFNITGKVNTMTAELNEQLAADEFNALVGL